MNVRDAVQKEVNRVSHSLDTIVVGTVIDFNPSSETCTVEIEKNGVLRIYSNVPWFSLGKGIKVSGPKPKQFVIVGFIDNNNALPIVLGLLSNNGLHVESREDVSGVYKYGRLRMSQ